ncbi:hypothetical protein O3P69_000394 [Scylla paramamosain]|uniref:Uncharacterized protein n=1 Tax=Scylla paramamosain TaxID=85552 RepID=A0AAW0UT67_SCYPA
MTAGCHRPAGHPQESNAASVASHQTLPLTLVVLTCLVNTCPPVFLPLIALQVTSGAGQVATRESTLTADVTEVGEPGRSEGYGVVVAAAAVTTAAVTTAAAVTTWVSWVALTVNC